MALSNVLYAEKQYQYAIIPETTAMTANVTSMKLIPVSGKPTITPNVFRRQAVQAGTGNTAKAADIKVAPLGSITSISIPTYMEETLIMMFLENGAGKARVIETGELVIAFNHTPAACGKDVEFTDNTGTLTYAEISPIAAKTEVYAGCVVSSITVSATKGTDNGLFSATVELLTQSPVLEGQSTPTGLAAYTLSSKTIGTLCDTSTIAAEAVNLNSLEVKYAFNPIHVGQCTDGDAITIRKNVPELGVDYTIGYAVDGNFDEEQTKGRLATTFALDFSDGTSSTLLFKSASVNPTTTPTYTDVEGVAMWTLNAKAFALTSGNLAEIQIG